MKLGQGLGKGKGIVISRRKGTKRRGMEANKILGGWGRGALDIKEPMEKEKLLRELIKKLTERWGRKPTIMEMSTVWDTLCLLEDDKTKTKTLKKVTEEVEVRNYAKK